MPNSKLHLSTKEKARAKHDSDLVRIVSGFGFILFYWSSHLSERVLASLEKWNNFYPQSKPISP